MRERWDHRDDYYEEEDYSVGTATSDASFIIWSVVIIALLVGSGPIFWEVGKLFAVMYIPLVIIFILASLGGSNSNHDEDEYDDDYDYDEYEEEEYDDH